MKCLLENFCLKSRKSSSKVFFSALAIAFSFVLGSLLAETPDPTGHEWLQYVDPTVDPKAELSLLPAPEILAQLETFLERARQEFKTTYGSDSKAFLEAVRKGLVYSILGVTPPTSPHPKDEEVQANGYEKNGLSDPNHARFEMTMIEETKKVPGPGGKITKRVIKRVAVKYAPKESSDGEGEYSQNSLRVLFYNVDHPINHESEPIDIHGEGASVYHARIGINTKRNVLALDLRDHSSIKGVYIHTPDRKDDGSKKVWKLYWKAKFEPLTWRNPTTGVVAATVQAAMSYFAFKYLGNSDHAFSLIPAVITWTNIFLTSTYSKTYANIIRSKSINKEVLLRTLTGLPLSIGLALANHADWATVSTYINVILIPLGDKISSAVFSFIPMVRSERGLTSGKKFLWETRSFAEREAVAWMRQIIQQLALANDTNPHAEFRHLGKLLVWVSALPAGFLDLWYANKMSKKYPRMAEDAERLKAWASRPVKSLGTVGRTAKAMCAQMLSSLTPTYSEMPIR
jgi:hypothetical protein